MFHHPAQYKMVQLLWTFITIHLCLHCSLFLRQVLFVHVNHAHAVPGTNQCNKGKRLTSQTLYHRAPRRHS